MFELDYGPYFFLHTLCFGYALSKIGLGPLRPNSTTGLIQVEHATFVENLCSIASTVYSKDYPSLDLSHNVPL